MARLATFQNLTDSPFTFARTNDSPTVLAAGGVVELDLADPLVVAQVRPLLRRARVCYAPDGDEVSVSDDFVARASSYAVDLSAQAVEATLLDAVDGEERTFFLKPGALHALTLNPGAGVQMEQLDGSGYDATVDLTAPGARYSVRKKGAVWNLA